MTEPEPSGWELMRASNALRGSVDTAVAGMVTQATLAIYQTAQKEKDDRQDARLKQLEQDRDEQRKLRERAESDARKTRAQQWFAIALAVLGGIVSIGVALILKGTGVS